MHLRYIVLFYGRFKLKLIKFNVRCVLETAKIRFVQVKMATTPGWGGGGRLINIVGKTQALRIMGASILLTGQQALDLHFGDVLAVNGESAINESIEYLDPYVYFSLHKEGESTTERKRNSVGAVIFFLTLLLFSQKIYYYVLCL